MRRYFFGCPPPPLGYARPHRFKPRCKPRRRASAAVTSAARGPMRISPKVRFRSRRWRSKRGQSLVEFALVLPVILVLTLIALDFGRIYLGYINLQNMAR